MENLTGSGQERVHPLSDQERIKLAKEGLNSVFERDQATRQTRLSQALDAETGVGPDVARLVVASALENEHLSDEAPTED